jgi:hypothetical protein
MTGLPTDVVAFLERAKACYDGAISGPDCADLSTLHSELKERYKNQPVVLESLDQWFFKVVQRVSVRPE